MNCFDQLKSTWLRQAEEQSLESVLLAMTNAPQIVGEIRSIPELKKDPNLAGVWASVGVALTIAATAQELLCRLIKSELGGQSMNQSDAHEMVDLWGQIVGAQSLLGDMLKTGDQKQAGSALEQSSRRVALLESAHLASEHSLTALGRRIGWDKVAPVLNILRSIILPHLSPEMLAQRQEYLTDLIPARR